MKISKEKFILLLVFLIAGFFRLYGISWDQGFHLHPDERAITLAVVDLEYPKNVSEFLSPDSNWNPKFFAYGSLPMYLLKLSGDFMGIFDSSFSQYANINLVGRFISAISDLIVTLLVFKLGKKLFNVKTGLIASFFYGISVLPIQLSHFYAVDTLLNLFIIATIYCLLNFYEKPTIKNSVLTGIFWALALATKISAAILVVPIFVTLVLFWINRGIKKTIKPAAAIIAITCATFLFMQPYTLIDFETFMKHTREQSLLTYDPFYFPFTLQYVDKIPYVHEFVNIFFWGLGPVLAMLSFTGTFYFIYQTFKNHKQKSHRMNNHVILSFFISYILVVGNFAVGFMRYMLPVYPFFAIFAAFFVYEFTKNIRPNQKLIIYYLFIITSLIWPFSFIQIYTQPNTRIQASSWISKNIPTGKTLAVEHWDDQLPLGKSTYNIEILELYNSDTKTKWNKINKQLSKSDYIIIASGRLKEPLTKLTNCDNLPQHRCYRETAKYYEKLFSGSSDFQKIVEFKTFPTVPFLNTYIDDSSADESFKVYDHPEVVIFKKTKQM